MYIAIFFSIIEWAHDYVYYIQYVTNKYCFVKH